MLFYSFKFLVFFAVLFVLYYFLLNRRAGSQNIILLIASYVFYGLANIKMLPLLLAVTFIFYYLGIGIEKAEKEKTKDILSAIGVAIGVGILLYFKYLNFFVSSFNSLLESIGASCSIHTLNILMPVGISFFVFRLISYIIEVHWEAIEPTHDFAAFATYVSFFPCILSGPIDRPEFLSQLSKKRTFDYDLAADGIRQFIWGLFKKLVVADNCAIYVDNVWSSISSASSSTLLLAAILYAFQLYADFSGYSDMAIAIGKVLGLKITQNFKYPFFAVNIADFWRRWHISLTSWMTDYVFMPLNLAFRNKKKMGTVLAIIINMFIVGMWHEANWTCAVYGLYHGLLFIPLVISGMYNKNTGICVNKLGLPIFRDAFRILLTFCLVLVGFMIFRAENIHELGIYLSGIATKSLFTMPFVYVGTKKTVLFVSLLLILEWITRNKEYSLKLDRAPFWLRLAACYVFILFILEFAAKGQSFIYFQF